VAAPRSFGHEPFQASARKAAIIDALITVFEREPALAKEFGQAVLQVWPGFREA
jgi:hypothetical protein